MMVIAPKKKIVSSRANAGLAVILIILQYAE